MPSIYATLEPTARKFLVYNFNDFAKHDKHAFRTAQEGDSFVWVCRPSATYLQAVACPTGPLEADSPSWQGLAALKGMRDVRAVFFVSMTGPHNGTVTELTSVPVSPAHLHEMLEDGLA